MARTRTSRPARRSRGDRGASIIEVAIGTPLLFALMLGTYTGGIALSHKNSMTNAVREGARLGATLSHNAAWANTVRGEVVDLAAGDVSASQVCVKLVEAPSTVIEASSCPSALANAAPSLSGIPAGQCVAVVWAARQDQLQAVFFSKDLPMAGEAVSRYERDCR
jgi:Flp pilus assembly protein TadG